VAHNQKERRQTKGTTNDSQNFAPHSEMITQSRRVRTPCDTGAARWRAARWRNKHGKRRHSSEQNKDIIAARSMLIIALTLWSTASDRSSSRPTRQRPSASDGASSSDSGGEGEAHESHEATSIDER
jgi:hypothetical protein